MMAKIAELNPAIVIVDSFRTLVPAAEIDGTLSVQEFVQRLAMKLTTWQATTFLLGEYPPAQIRENPVFTMADGLLMMCQHVSRNSMVRQIQVLKMRGNSPQPGLHTIRISERRRAGLPAHAEADRGNAIGGHRRTDLDGHFRASTRCSAAARCAATRC